MREPAVRRLAVAAALLAACAEPLPVVVYDDGVSPLDVLPPSVVRACEIIEIECEADDERYGAVTIDLVSTKDGVQERALDAVCTPSIRSVDDALKIAHGFGHVFELKHRGERANLMNILAESDRLDAGQLDDVWAAAGLLVGCR